MFEVEKFIADCEAAVSRSSHKGVREVVAEAVSDPAAVLRGLGEPTKGNVQIHNTNTLTIINVVWAPWMTIMPHNHEMWAVIGIYTGREDNMFWRRVEGAPTAISKPLVPKTCRLAKPRRSAICYSVTDPIPRLTGAIHVYGGDFFATPRSEWDSETLTEAPYDVEKTMRLFEEFGSA